ncbi:sedoheptulokinase-like [Acanthaster planci]|uniref:Sedoheptulokinase n=1 Tax=Acanthaster planci TaxID=133434 RepID=A0A8B7Y1Y5_ACAPL|nr:sedoheptulokinase-like [Acanthaster planci]
METDSKFVLGIDLGTSSVKVCVYDPETEHTVQSAVSETNAKITRELQPPGAAEQDVTKILEACEACLRRLDADHLKQVQCIGIAGQMHGCVCWSGHDGTELNPGLNQLDWFDQSILTSQLVTWQDGRCTPEFIATLPKPDSHLRLATGHGCATLFWLQQNSPQIVERFEHAGTVMDLLVAMLCNLTATVMSVQNAASWGYFNVTEKQWNQEILSSAGFPVHLLPKVVDPGSIVGKLCSSWCGIPAGCEVGVAMGDLPCSVLPSLEWQTDAVVNISTSAQLVTSTPPAFNPPKSTPSSTVEYFPYFRGQYLAVAAALTGGNVLEHFVSTMQEWARELGLQISKDEAYEKMIEKGLGVEETDLWIVPTLFGERHIPSQRASILNLTMANASLGDTTRALCQGVIQNLHDMMSKKDLFDRGIKRIIGCGSALLRNKVLMQELERAFQLPVDYKKGGDAAEGAAVAMAMLVKQQTEKP